MDFEPEGAEAASARAVEEPSALTSQATSDASPRTIHRIGGATLKNLRLKPAEAALTPPGISVIQAPTPAAAAEEMRAGYPNARKLQEQAKVVGSASVQAVVQAGFQVIPTPSRWLPNHHRIIHPDGAAGFSDENLARLAEAFVTTTGH